MASSSVMQKRPRSSSGVGTLRVVCRVPPLDEDHLHGLVAQPPAQHGAVPGRERRLVHHQLVRIDGALHDVLAQTVRRVDEDDVPEPRFGVQGEHHARGGDVGTHHLHHTDRQADLEVVEALVDPVVDGAIGEQTGKAATTGVQQALLAADVQEGLLLAGEAGVRKVLGGGRAAHRQAQPFTVLFDQLAVAGADGLLEIPRQSCAVNHLARDLCASLQIGHVLGIQPVQRLMQAGPGIRLIQHVPVGGRRDGESVGHAHALTGQLPVHLTERGVLATHGGHVVDAHLFEHSDVRRSLHVHLHVGDRWQSTARAAAA